jgi:hypothetical protein
MDMHGQLALPPSWWPLGLTFDPCRKKPTVAVLAHMQDFLIEKIHKLEELVDLLTKNEGY